MRTLPFLALAALAACQTALPDRPTAGSITLDGVSYPIEVTAFDTWIVHVGDERVFCTKKTEESCYWSARVHMDNKRRIEEME